MKDVINKKLQGRATEGQLPVVALSAVALLLLLFPTNLFAAADDQIERLPEPTAMKLRPKSPSNFRGAG
jgi:hypothetical protein